MSRFCALALLCLTQCNGALREAMARAEAAHGRGDHFGEAVALRDACAAAPSEQEICAAARESADEVIGKQLQVASGPCQTEPTACLAALEVLAPFAGPLDARLTPYFDRAGDMFAERCGRAPLDTAEDAVFIVRCAEAYRARIPTPGYAAQLGRLRQRAGAFLAQQAAARAAAPGVAWLYASLAGCLGGEAAYAPRVRAYRDAFDDAHAVRLSVSGQAAVAPATLCAQLQQRFGGIVRCDGRGASELPLQVVAWLDQLTDAPLHEVRAVDVLDHTERWENPDYRFAQARLREARRNAEQADRVERLASAECATARSALSRARSCTNCRERSRMEQSCNREQAAEDIERRARRELDDASRALSRTPAMLSRDVYRTMRYRNIEHRFRVAWHVRVGVAGSAPVERSGVLTWESTERDGVPEAGVAFLPYSEPTHAQRYDRLAGLAYEQALEVLTRELDRRAQARLAVCPAPNEWSDCQVEAALLKGTDPVAQFAADVGAKLDAKFERPWPKADCAP